MKARLLALAAFLASVGAGVYFVNFNDGTADALPDSFGSFEVVDRSMCSASPCNSVACNQAQDILTDGGSGNCTLRFIDCPVRLGARARAQASDAGVVFTAAKYQQVRLIAMRCPANGPGFALGIPVDDAGWPVFATSSALYPCAWRPAGGSSCARVDGGDPGDENTMQPGEWVGGGCVRKSCVEVAGESSAP